MSRFYAGVRALARFWVWFFFKALDARHPERVPATGPVLLCINHPNNLIDSLAVGVVVRRQLHYLATASLFRSPLVARFLRAAGAIAVYRRQDRESPDGRGDPNGAASGNAEAFAAVAQAFREGRVVAIYPEGTTHAEARVQRLKTGAARLALAFDAERPDELAVIPVGLTFEARKSFRARVLVSFGERLPIAAWRAAYRDDPATAVLSLTEHLQTAMENEVVNVARIDDARLVRAVEELYRDELARQVTESRGIAPRDVDPLRLSRSIVAAIDFFKAREPARVEVLWQRIQAYRALLAQYRLRDETVKGRLARVPARKRLVYSWDAIAGFPFFAYGALVNLLPHLLPRWLARRTARKETDYATTRLLASIVAYPLFWGLETWLVAWLAGSRLAVLFAVSLPLSGLLAYRYLVGAGRLRARLRFALFAAAHEADARRLVAEREAIVAELGRAKTDYLTATRGSSF